MQCPATQVAFVDDVQENIDAANACGFHGLLYHPGPPPGFRGRTGDLALGLRLGGCVLKGSYLRPSAQPVE